MPPWQSSARVITMFIVVETRKNATLTVSNRVLVSAFAVVGLPDVMLRISSRIRATSACIEAMMPRWDRRVSPSAASGEQLAGQPVPSLSSSSLASTHFLCSYNRSKALFSSSAFSDSINGAIENKIVLLLLLLYYILFLFYLNNCIYCVTIRQHSTSTQLSMHNKYT